MTCVFIHNAHHVYMTFIYYMCLCFVCRRCCCCCCLSACLSVCLCAQQLMKYEANNDTTDLSAMDRCAKMLKRKVTAKVAGLVEAAAAAAAVAAAGTAEDSLPADPDYATRAVTTAGDALLIYLTAESEAKRREYEQSETQLATSQDEVFQLLAQEHTFRLISFYFIFMFLRCCFFVAVVVSCSRL